MRSMIRATVIAPILCLMAVAAGHAQSACTKIGYVNTQVLMEAAPGRIAAESLLNKMGDGFRAVLAKEQDSAQKMLVAYQKDQATMTAANKDKAEKALQAIEGDLQAKQQTFQQQFDAKSQEVMGPVKDVVKSVLDGLREEGCYAIIFDNAQGASGIVSADKNLDITDKAVSRLRATPAPKIKATETTTAPVKGAPASPAGVTGKPPKPPTQ
jgi:Skp family chaperone for outer membrane proteins